MEPTTEQRLIDAARAISGAQLARAFAHQAKNDLWSVVGLADILAGDLPEGDPVRHRLELIAVSGRNLQDQARALSDFLKLADYDDKDMCLAAEVCQRAIELVNTIQLTKGVEICGSYEQDTVMVRCPEHALVSALCQLLVNAQQAYDDQNGKVQLHLRTDAGQAIISIADDGAGILEEVADGLFEPFVTTKNGQLGLGLCSASAIAARYGGSLQLQSSEGGTVATLKLPLLSS